MSTAKIHTANPTPTIKYIVSKNPNDPIYARTQEQKLFIKRSKLYQRRLKRNSI